MKKVTTNITFGQILFILFIFMFASLIFFYLGAKFGPRILSVGGQGAQSTNSILPDEKVALEIQELLKDKTHDFVFYDALQNKNELKSLVPQKTYEDSFEAFPSVPAEVLQELKKEVVKADTENSTNKKEKDETQQDKDAQKEKQLAQEKLKLKEKEQLEKEAKEAKRLAELEKAAVQEKVNLDEDGELNVKTADPLVVTPEPTVQASNYYLQMGSYSKESKALQAKQLWESRGYTVTLFSFDNKDKGKWYRLRLGGYNNYNEAMNAQKTVMNKFRQSVSVVSSGSH